MLGCSARVWEGHGHDNGGGNEVEKYSGNLHFVGMPDCVLTGYLVLYTVKFHPLPCGQAGLACHQFISSEVDKT